MLAGIGGQGLLTTAPDGALPTDAQAGFAQENIQYAQYGNTVGQMPGEQANAYAYQQQIYPPGSAVEGQQYTSTYDKIRSIILPKLSIF